MKTIKILVFLAGKTGKDNGGKTNDFYFCSKVYFARHGGSAPVFESLGRGFGFKSERNFLTTQPSREHVRTPEFTKKIENLRFLYNTFILAN